MDTSIFCVGLHDVRQNVVKVLLQYFLPFSVRIALKLSVLKMSLHHYSKSQLHRSIRGVVRTRPRRTLNKWSKEFDIRLHRRRTWAVQSHSPVCPRVTHASFGPPESTTQTASRSVKPFLHSSRQSVVGHVGACPRPPPLKIAHSSGRSGTPSNIWFLEPIRAHN